MVAADAGPVCQAASQIIYTVHWYDMSDMNIFHDENIDTESMQSCLTSEWLECLGCIHSLGWSWHQTGTFGVQGLFLKIMFSPWSSM